MINKTYSLFLAWLISLVSVLGSLYFSEIVKHEPCQLCWFQRICIFPLALILGIASWKNFFGIATYALPLVAIGLGFALYQIAIQEIPGWQPIDLCGAGPSCTEKYPIGLGPITIPMLSALALAIQLLLLLRIHKS
jgi:disulfide bond formation protein DsbB